MRYLIKTGSKSGPHSVGRVLRESWEATRARVDKMIEDGKARGFPPMTGDGKEIRPLGPYAGEADLDDVLVTVIARSLADVRATELELEGLLEEVGKAGLTVEESVKLVRAAVETKARFVQASVARVDACGDELGNGEGLTADEVALLADNGLLDRVYEAVIHLHSLRGDARKNCGASQP